MPRRYTKGKKALVLRVHDYFDREKRCGQRRYLRNVLKRTEDATGISLASVKKFISEAKAEVAQPQEDAATTQGRRKIVVDEFMRSDIRRQVHSFYREKTHPTVEQVFQRCKDEVNNFPQMGKTTFWKLLRSIGFKYVKTRGNTKLMMERNDIVICSLAVSFSPEKSTASQGRKAHHLFG